ncbi:MAG: pyridoxal phosphate-dependent aminotransferase [Gammaproteobacteria bacterium]|nr:pyridoxal phosphate-dependent aminotransferase [Gammaproteobacteria bacterium]NND40189.1 pyridoxal phosphate-dependent aminotransferase [Pseudomonadales bacterium]NNM11525.1 pyridoxal phosphate-dependent aminotransferase [Pseudomonadales bacterium]RZV56754.1 MAG: pyridoxal phosphate-dependent aminotransferase [Pseudomonadales bacterium]
MKSINKSQKLRDVCYDIRGPVLREATRLEDEGQRILKLNIGNPAAFGLLTPDEILQDVIHNLPDAQGYCASKGLYSARKAIMQDCQIRGIPDVEIDDIYLGNGVSELIVMAMQGLLNSGDEVLIPAPDYPLWTAAVSLCSGKPVHYLCDENNRWQPDIADIESKINENTRAIVLINPNNPTGAVYSKDTLKEIAELARKHQLIVCADEIYDRILYDGAEHIPFASIAEDILCLTFSGLSKSYRLAGFRSGWMIVTGRKLQAQDFLEGLDILSSMRLCANVPAQYAIQTALGGYQSINDLVLPTGRLGAQRDLAYDKLTAIPGVSCVKPKGAIYLFPKLDEEMYPIEHDERLMLELLLEQKLLLVQGSAFNLPSRQHLRLVFLPPVDVLENAIDRLAEFLDSRRK